MPDNKYLDKRGLSSYTRRIKDYVNDAIDSKVVTIDDLKSQLEYEILYETGIEHAFIINGVTVSDVKQAILHLDTEAIKKIIGSIDYNNHNYLIFQLMGYESNLDDTGKSIPLQVEFNIATDPDTGDSYITPHVYSLKVVTNNNTLEVAPVEADNAVIVSGLVYFKIE